MMTKIYNLYSGGDFLGFFWFLEHSGHDYEMKTKKILDCGIDLKLENASKDKLDR